MQLVINISEESYKNIKEQVDKRDYPDMQIGKAIVDGVLTSNLGVPAFERLNAKECASLDIACKLIDQYEARLKAGVVAVLDKIRAEIEQERVGYPPSADYYKAIMNCLKIIDKHKTESEE